MSKSKPRVLFLTPYPFDTAGSQRFRFEQYYGKLREEGYITKSQGFLSHQTWNVLYRPGSYLKKTSGLIAGVIRRVITIFTAWRYDYIFIHREAAPLGPPVIEWILAKLFSKKVIYDFDDAIWLPNTSKANGLSKSLKWNSKVASICRWCRKVSVGNAYLAEYARQFSENVVLNPTTIDTTSRHIPIARNNKKPVIGWTGTHSTLKYLEMVADVLNDLNQKYDFELLIIADQKPKIELPNMRFVRWSEETEIDDLNRIDVGFMPLTDDPWSKGKCGFKALQFMALEIPVLVSPVGVNINIVEDGKSGFHCNTRTEWLEGFAGLLQDATLRASMGKAGRRHVEEHYSIKSNAKNFISLFSD